MSTASILILEDDIEMRSLLVRGLREEGYRAEGVGNGGALLDWSRAPFPTPSSSTSDYPTPTGATSSRPCARRGSARRSSS